MCSHYGLIIAQPNSIYPASLGSRTYANPVSMMLFANLPFSRQMKSARQHILVDLRKSINSFGLTKQDAPRIRIRSLDVIPLALSLPRSSSLSKITQAIVNCSSLDEWFQLQIFSPFTIKLLDNLLSFFSSPQPHLTQRIPSLLTWNPSSLSTIHQQPSLKINLVLKRAQSHICLIQETNWSSVQYQHLLLSSPFCKIFLTLQPQGMAPVALPPFCLDPLLPQPTE